MSRTYTGFVAAEDKQGAYATSLLIDNAVEDEAKNNFHLRKVDHINVTRLNDKRCMKIFELMGVKTVSEDEWMYQLESGAANDPYTAFTSAVDLYLEGKISEALAALNGMPTKDAASERLLAVLGTAEEGKVPALKNLD